MIMKISKAIRLLSLAILAVSCQSMKEGNGSINIAEGSTFTPVIASAGGTATIEFTTNCDWNANVPNISSYSWSSITPTSGGAGTNVITVTALRNDNYDDRSFTFDIKASGALQTVTVTQRQKDALTVTSGEFEIPEEGGDVKIELMSNIEYGFKVEDDGKDWIIPVPAGKGLEPSELLFDVLPTDVFEVRTGHITISSEGLPDETITVTQAAKTRVFEVSPTAITVEKEGGKTSFTVNCNFGYTVTMEECDWIEPLSDITGTLEGNRTFEFDVDTYDQIPPRSVDINIETGVEGYSATVTITQTGTVIINEKWMKTYSSDLTEISNVGPMRFAYLDNYLIVSDGSAVHLVDRSTGTYVNKVEIPGNIAVKSLTTDDAGNIVFATDAAYPDGVLNVYCLSSIEDTPELVLSYTHNSIYSSSLGNIRVVGNVKDKAVVTGICSGSVSYWIAWQIEGGTAQAPVYGEGLAGIWGTNQCAINAVSANLSDGLLRIGYAGDYNLEYCQDPASNTWTTIFQTASSWAENYGSLSVKEFDGKRLCAIGRGAYAAAASGGLVGAYLVDITDTGNAFQIYDIGSEYTGDAFVSVTDNSNEVLLVDDGDEINLYMTDNACDYILNLSFAF